MTGGTCRFVTFGFGKKQKGNMQKKGNELKNERRKKRK